MIDQAKELGFDAVKFQKRDPDISTPEKQKQIMRSTPFGRNELFKLQKKNRI